ncbi:secretory phospholipase A2 receptor-like isoform 1-T1 [Menidia menidia]
MRNIFIFVSLWPAIGLWVSGLELNLTLVNMIKYSEWKTWEKAQSFCREKHMDLVTVRDEKDNQAIVKHSGWIGLYRDEQTSLWKWSRGDEPAEYTNWRTGAPYQNEHCGWKYDNTDEWRSDECDEIHTFLCSDEKLVLVKENKTWEEALEHCRSLVSGEPFYDLATLTTADDHHYAQGRAQQAATEEVWTGLRFLGDAWFWVGGEQVQYSELPSCPALRCGVLEKNSQTSFGLRDCSERRNFFCYRRAGNMGTE